MCVVLLSIFVSACPLASVSSSAFVSQTLSQYLISSISVLFPAFNDLCTILSSHLLVYPFINSFSIGTLHYVTYDLHMHLVWVFFPPLLLYLPPLLSLSLPPLPSLSVVAVFMVFYKKKFPLSCMFLAVLVWFGFGSCLTGLRIGLFVCLLA